MADDENRSITSTEGSLSEARYMWMDTRQLAVNDTIADKVVSVTLVKLTSIGESDVPVARGQVPTEKLAAIYAAVDVRQKSFGVEMQSMEGQPCGTCKVKIMFSTELLQKTEEEKAGEEMVPAGNLAAAQQQ